jgi:threonine dehydrogenase-like Zn-dependent dehydrogenase
LIASGQVDTQAIVSAVYPISEWHQAFAEFEAKQGLKILLTPLSD